MTAIINNYADAAALFAKARRPEKGKPLDARHWRLFKDGDEFVVNYLSVQAARILPTNQLIVMGYADRNPPQGLVATSARVLPICIIRRSSTHYRVHAITSPGGGPYRQYGMIDWKDMLTGGVRLYHDATFDLVRRVWLSAPEVAKTVDVVARKDWLAKSKHIQNVFRTMIRLGAIDARIRAKDAAGPPWKTAPVHLIRPRSHEFAALVEAVRTGIVPEELADLFAQSCRTKYYDGGGAAEQLKHVSAIFERNSLALRTALGVITIK